jgi:hypothetical protein
MEQSLIRVTSLGSAGVSIRASTEVALLGADLARNIIFLANKAKPTGTFTALEIDQDQISVACETKIEGDLTYQSEQTLFNTLGRQRLVSLRSKKGLASFSYEKRESNWHFDSF